MANGEEALIQRIKARYTGASRPEVTSGIGDDSAILEPPPDHELLVTTDLFIEQVHFLPGVHPAAAAGYKTLARGLSDIAAMGGEARYCLISIAIAPWVKKRWLDGFYKGLSGLAGRHGITLIGGDIGHAAVFVADIVVIGVTPKGAALKRSGARPGDWLYVTGELGGAALGLATRKGRAWRAHLKPEPRLAQGITLRKLGATSAIDITDGFALDLHRLLKASGVGARIDREVPRFPGASEEQALHGGDDYELLFTLPEGIEAPPEVEGVPLTRIGSIQPGKPGVIRYLRRRLPPRGYDHLAYMLSPG